MDIPMYITFISLPSTDDLLDRSISCRSISSGSGSGSGSMDSTPKAPVRRFASLDPQARRIILADKVQRRHTTTSIPLEHDDDSALDRDFSPRLPRRSIEKEVSSFAPRQPTRKASRK